MSHKSTNQYFDSLNSIPIEVQNILSFIRDKDKQILDLAVQLEPKRNQLMEIFSNSEGAPTQKQKKNLFSLYSQIKELEAEQIHLASSKMILAQQLYNSIDSPTQILERELDGQVQSQAQKKKKNKEETEWDYEGFQPQYCYCRGPSFGEMVMCENRLCETQWFHLPCIQQPIGKGQSWYCKGCRKQQKKPKYRKT